MPSFRKYKRTERYNSAHTGNEPDHNCRLNGLPKNEPPHIEGARNKKGVGKNAFPMYNTVNRFTTL